MAKILIVDDEPRIRELIREHLEHEGFQCEEATDGSAALAALRPRHADWAATVIEAKAWLSAALAQADSLEVGHGIGPVHHFHAWW